jgi:hypothetical protein
MKPWHIVLFVLALAIFAAVLAPVGVLAPQKPGAWTYASAQGNAWGAKFTDAKVGPLKAGDVEWRLNPGALLTGSAGGDARFSGGQIKGDAAVRFGLGGARAINSKSLSVEGIPWRGGALAGIILLRDLDIAFANGRCARARGTAESDILTRNASSLGWAGPALAGEARCTGRDAVVAMIDNTGDVEARLTMRPDGGATWRLGVRSASGERAALLAANGFAPDHTGAPGMEMTGEMRWAPF